MFWILLLIVTYIACGFIELPSKDPEAWRSDPKQNKELNK